MGLPRRAWSKRNSDVCAIASLKEDMAAVSIIRDALCGTDFRIVRGQLTVHGMLAEGTRSMGWSECIQRCKTAKCL